MLGVLKYFRQKIGEKIAVFAHTTASFGKKIDHDIDS
jgi:hypothetical protein